MRDLTREEIEEYFRFAIDDERAADFHQDQAALVGEALLDCGYFDVVTGKMLQAKRAGLGPTEVMVSLWVAAFQMGRECESRLLTLALKGKPRR